MLAMTVKQSLRWLVQPNAEVQSICFQVYRQLQEDWAKWLAWPRAGRSCQPGTGKGTFVCALNALGKIAYVLCECSYSFPAHAGYELYFLVASVGIRNQRLFE